MVVSFDAAHFRSGEHYRRWLVISEPLQHRQRIEQLELSAAEFELVLVVGALQSATDGTGGHASGAKDRDAITRSLSRIDPRAVLHRRP